MNGVEANSFSQRDVDDGVVEFVQQDRPRRLYDGSREAGFEFDVLSDGRVSKPMFFPISVGGDEALPIPQVKQASLSPGRLA